MEDAEWAAMRRAQESRDERKRQLKLQRMAKNRLARWKRNAIRRDEAAQRGQG